MAIPLLLQVDLRRIATLGMIDRILEPLTADQKKVVFSSPQSMLTNSVFYTNGRMRRALGWAPSSRGPARLLAPAYLLAAKALKTWAPHNINVECAHMRWFDVDLSAPNCIRWRDGLAPDWAVPAKPVRKVARRWTETLKAA